MMRWRVFVLAVACSLVSVSVMAQAKKSNRKPAPAAASAKSGVASGKAVYVKYCISCHQPDGGGVQNMNPPLIKTSYVLGPKPKLISVLLNGLSRQEIDGERYNNVMASFSYLTDQQIADVLTYVRKSFGNKASAVTPAEVKSVRPQSK